MTTLDKFNPLRPSPVNPVKQAHAGVSADGGAERQNLAAPGKLLPQSLVERPVLFSAEQELKQAVNNISDYVQNIRRELNFSVDEKLGRTIVTVIDEKSGDVIRQIPSEEMLEIARSIARMKERSSKGLLFDGDA